MIHVKAFFAVLVVAGLLSIPWYFYQDFLNQGRAPTRSAQILNQLEKNGIKDFELTDYYSGERVQLSHFQDRVVLINFWASWCVPCVKEVPSMIQLAKKLGEKLEVLAISQDKHEDDLKAFLKGFEPFPENFRILRDPEGVISKGYGTEVLPESYIVGPGLKLVRKVVGVEVWDHDQAIQFFGDIYSSLHKEE
ncbi:MAG TPA: hypothetical protein DCL41_02720 [Bdellovibrionales bacterium]|nr:hypothetical protein [Pseudobdellovibrionaceae bacterium]HAG90754.1 hypothetical protein [Bdellovibrionales bacterium]|tara:strand:- start:1238 stop:1816 length:579 start_codon:yes stop_codon:yes gene_type:complete